MVFFAFGALTYPAHPEGILEFQKRRWTLRFERMIFHPTRWVRVASRVSPEGWPRPSSRRSATMAEPGAGPLLQVTGVTKVFGGILAVNDVTMEVGAGESIGLVGPNGAGKTTLFNCICGQLRPERGAVTLEGRDLLGLPTYQRARRGSVGPTSGSRSFRT